MTYEEIIKKAKLILICDKFGTHYIPQNARFPENKKCIKYGKILNINDYKYEDDVYRYINLIYRIISKKPILKFIDRTRPLFKKSLNPMEAMKIGESLFKDLYKNVDKSQDIIIASFLLGYVDSSIGIKETQKIVLKNLSGYKLMQITNLTKYTIDVDSEHYSDLLRYKKWDKFQIEALGDKKISKIDKCYYPNYTYNLEGMDLTFLNKYLLDLIDKDPKEALALALASNVPKEFIEPELLTKLKNIQKR